MIAWLNRYRTVFLVLATIALWSAIFYFVPEETFVESVGLEHAYIVSFVITLLAGFSAFTGTTAYAAVIEFSRGGADPLLLGVVSGVGLFLSDTAFYLLVMRGRTSVQDRFKRFFEKLQRFLDGLPAAAVYVVVYLFCAFGPIPNDLVLTLLVVSGYRYRKLWPVLLAGDITFMLFLSYLFQQ